MLKQFLPNRAPAESHGGNLFAPHLDSFVAPLGKLGDANGSGLTTSCWPSWRVSDYAASGREEPARFAGTRVILRTPVGIIRKSALCHVPSPEHLSDR